jgi:hypothetical protein
MAGRAYGNLMAAGRATVATANGAGLRRGPSNKNLGPSRVSKPHPAPSIRSTAGKAIKGPDKGAGGQ